MTAVSVSIVTYNNADEIADVLDSVFSATKGVDLTVYVVDNASTDHTCDVVASRYPTVNLIRCETNDGFGAGHNRVLDLLESDCHVILNPDIVFETDVISSLADYLMSHDDTVLVTPLINNADGSMQPVPRVLPKRRYMFAGQLERFGGIFRKWRDEYTRRRETFDRPTAITFCTGCFMMVKTAALRKVGGFDDRFFMYMEDADLSRRLSKLGKLILLPAYCVTHRWEKASGKSMAFLKIHLRSMRMYFAKWRNEA